MNAVVFKTPEQIEMIRRAGTLAAKTLFEVSKILKPGLSTLEINDFVHEYTIKNGGKPAPLNYRSFPKSCCTSINEVICHGIPSSRKIKDGDIINIDVTTILNGWHGDVSATFPIGNISAEAKRLVEVTKRCLELGIAAAKPNARLGDIGYAIQSYAESNGFSVVRDFIGHGIGKQFHEAPQVLHVGEKDKGLRLKPGMVFTIEPMINQGTFESKVLDDKWTAVTKDGKLSAQFEHTVAITDHGVDILTAL